MSTNKGGNLKRIQQVVDLIQDKKGTNLVVLDMTDHSVAADYFVIADGDNPKHVQALAESVMEGLEEEPLHQEGLDSRHWVALDYGDLWVHLFEAEVRLFYDLDGLWADRIVSPEELDLELQAQ
ncbi:MAG: ribosome silencing factor [Candidatus Bipolaricaulota bacterium]